MGIAIEIIRQAAPTVTGTQDFNASAGFGTPKAAILIATKAVADATAIDHRILSFGVCTGAANEWVCSNTDEHGQGDSDNDRILDTSHCVMIRNPGAETTDGSAEFSSFGVDKLTLNWDNALATAVLVTCILFAGSDLSAHANTFVGSTQDTEVNITDPGFEPDVIISAHVGRGIDSSVGHFQQGFGIIHNDGAGGITQRSNMHNSRTGITTSACFGYAHATRGGVQIGITDGTLSYSVEYSNFDSSGFSVTYRDGNSFGDAGGYLALKFANHSSSVTTQNSPTSMGENGHTGVGFKPQLVLLLVSGAEATGTTEADDDAGTHGISAFTAGEAFWNGGTSDDNVGTTNTESFVDDQPINMKIAAGADELIAATPSVAALMNSDGYTLDYTTVDAQTKIIFALCVEESVAVGPPPRHPLSKFPMLHHVGR